MPERDSRVYLTPTYLHARRARVQAQEHCAMKRIYRWKSQRLPMRGFQLETNQPSAFQLGRREIREAADTDAQARCGHHGDFEVAWCPEIGVTEEGEGYVGGSSEICCERHSRCAGPDVELRAEGGHPPAEDDGCLRESRLAISGQCAHRQLSVNWRSTHALTEQLCHERTTTSF